jgi:hypothetical protein
LSGGFGEARSSSNGRESVFTREDFDAVGGSGSMTSNGWTVTDMDTVPVRYDLRPLSELVSPVFFPAKGDFNTSMKYNRARMALVNEIESRMNGAPRFSNQSIAPDIFQVEFHQLTCLKNGDEGNQPADLFGKIVFGWHGDGGVGSIEVLNAPENRRISCAGQGSGIPLGQKQMIIASPTGPEAQKSGFGNFYLIAAQLYEDDNSFTDPDDPIKEKISHVGRRLKDYADRGLQTDTLADPNPQWGPTLTVTYTIKRLK